MEYSIGNKISSIRKKQGMTQAQFAEVSGLSASYIAKIELGNILPAPKNFIRIIEKLDLKFSDILDFLADYVKVIGYGDSQILSNEFHDSTLSHKFYKRIFELMTVYTYSNQKIEYNREDPRERDGFTDCFFISGIKTFFLGLNKKYAFVEPRENFQTFISTLHLFNSSLNKFALYFVKRSDCEKIYAGYVIDFDEKELYIEECQEELIDQDEYLVTSNMVNNGIIDEILSSKDINKPKCLLNTPFYHGYAQYNQYFPVVIIYVESSAYDMINELTLETDPNIIILKDIIKKIKSDNGSALSKQAYNALGEFLSYINNSLGHNS